MIQNKEYLHKIFKVRAMTNAVDYRFLSLGPSIIRKTSALQLGQSQARNIYRLFKHILIIILWIKFDFFKKIFFLMLVYVRLFFQNVREIV